MLREIDSHGVRLASEAFGNPADPAIVLIMGATASMLGWPDAFCAALAAGGRFVIRFDHRDTGRSDTLPPGGAGYAVEDMAGDVLAVLDGWGLPRAHLAGMSLGGYIAQMVAVAQPARVESLTLIAAEPLGWEGEPLPSLGADILGHFGGLATLDWGDEAAVTAFLVGTERLCAGSGAPFDAARAQAQAARVLARTDSPASMFNHATLSLRDDWSGAHRRISCPVLVIHGEEDPVLPPENGRAIAGALPGAALVLMPGTGHEIPERMFISLARRIADHTAAPG